jgi:transcriptional regulator with XRE-family HTH domain
LRNYSQEYVASRIHVSQTTYSKIENGSTKLDIIRFMGIAKALEVDPEIFFKFDPKLPLNKYVKPDKHIEYFQNISDEARTKYEEKIRNLEMKNKNLTRIIARRYFMR